VLRIAQARGSLATQGHKASKQRSWYNIVWAWWQIPIIPVTQEAEIGVRFKDSPSSTDTGVTLNFFGGGEKVFVTCQSGWQ
jgi:hypothetical protein